MNILRLAILISIICNLSVAPMPAAGSDVFRAGPAAVMPGDVFDAVLLCNLPLGAVTGLIESECPVAPALAAKKSGSAGETGNTAHGIGILPGSFPGAQLQQAGRMFPFLAQGPLQGGRRASFFSMRAAFALPPGGGFFDALRCYLVTIGVAALPSAMSAAMAPTII